ncbi:MAG: hypothetical protein PSV35_07885 [bacterium]|nr:hypothetical protein [bacterium]
MNKGKKLAAAKALQSYVQSANDNHEAKLIVTKDELAALQQGRLKQIAAPFLVKTKIEVIELREREQKLDNDDEYSAMIDKKIS